MNTQLMIATALRPFAALLLFTVVVWPLEWLLGKLIPEGRIKRLLWKRWGD